MNRKFLAVWVVMLSLTVSRVDAQSNKVIIVNGQPLIDVTRLGLRPGYAPGVDNAALLNAAMPDSSYNKYGFYFPGGVWRFDSTVVANFTGRKFVGNGIARLDSGDGFEINNGTPSKIVWGGGALSFDGSSITAASQSFTFDGTSVSATCPVDDDNQSTTTDQVLTLVGHEGQADEVGDFVTITGGAGFLPGVYQITAATSTTWTLDANCTNTSTPGTSLVGTGLGARIQLTGHAVENSDLLHTLEINPGTNWIDGKYHINSVVTGAPNRWVLDRPCATTGGRLAWRGARRARYGATTALGTSTKGCCFVARPVLPTTTMPTRRSAGNSELTSRMGRPIPANRKCGTADSAMPTSVSSSARALRLS